MKVSPTCWQPPTRQNSVKTRQTSKTPTNKQTNEPASEQACNQPTSKQESKQAKQFLALQAATSLSIKGQGYISM
jgi:hypothetical protein